MWGVQPSLRRGVIAITLVACVGLAAAQTGRRGVGDTDASAMDETTGSVARPGKRAGAELALSDELNRVQIAVPISLEGSLRRKTLPCDRDG